MGRLSRISFAHQRPVDGRDAEEVGERRRTPNRCPGAPTRGRRNRAGAILRALRPRAGRVSRHGCVRADPRGQPRRRQPARPATRRTAGTPSGRLRRSFGARRARAVPRGHHGTPGRRLGARSGGGGTIAPGQCDRRPAPRPSRGTCSLAAARRHRAAERRAPDPDVERRARTTPARRHRSSSKQPTAPAVSSSATSSRPASGSPACSGASTRQSSPSSPT